jgi:endonuclease/exonuclease/phosphatase family metal-dependent hydrolase
MTYNIRVGLGANGTREGNEPIWRLQGIASLIEQSDADIVLLQEVDKNRERSARVDQAAFLADELGYEFRYAPAIESEDGQLYGIAILSRWPIRDETVTKLHRPDYSDREPELPEYYSEQRLAQSVTIDAPSGPVTAINTHLGLTYEQRVEQLEEIGQIVEERLADGPVILGGDLNSQPDVPSLWPVRERLRDAYLFHTNENGLTRHMDVSERFTIPSDDPNRCIDYIFVSDEHFDVAETEIPATTLSDHLPVVARLMAK